jgi:hypothetical protein
VTNRGGQRERRQRLEGRFGFWAAVVLTVALVYVALQARNAGGRMPRVA